MRNAILMSVLFLSSASAPATDPASDTARRVRVALALASAAQCGECRFDEAGCRLEASVKQRPLVLFVGGTACSRCGLAVKASGGIPCVVDSYDGDGLGAKPRAVVLTPKPAGAGWWIGDTLTGFTEEKVRAAVEKAKPKAPEPAPSPAAPALNWTK